MFTKLLATLVFGIVLATSALAQGYRIEPVIEGLDEPWGIGLLPDGDILITERDGQLILWQKGAQSKVRGLPRVAARGQGGLLDITVARDFAQTREVFLTYSKPQAGGGAGTALAIARLSNNGQRLERVRDLFETRTGARGGRHFGSRVVEAADGTLWITVGDRGDRDSAQDRTNHNGTIVRVMRDGKVPEDNPFVGQTDVQPEIWSYGHRNPQGADFDANGTLWVSEHGARGGDEINLVRKGANYGWPVISYGRHYSGAKIGEGTAKSGMEQPEFYWDPSIAPSGLLAYDGEMLPQWRGDLFVGSLKFDYISRLSGTPLREVERISTPETGRVRDLAQGPNGEVFFLSVTNGALYRIIAQ